MKMSFAFFFFLSCAYWPGGCSLCEACTQGHLGVHSDARISSRVSLCEHTVCLLLPATVWIPLLLLDWKPMQLVFVLDTVATVMVFKCLCI